jgi:hypothetical protein
MTEQNDVGEEQLNRHELRTLIRQETASLRRRVSDKHINKLIAAQTAPIVDRLDITEKNVATMMGSVIATRDMLSRMDEKLDRQHQEMLARLDRAEVWITRRAGIEKSVLRIGGLAVWAAARRVFPFLAAVGGVLSVSYVLAMIMG